MTADRRDPPPAESAAGNATLQGFLDNDAWDALLVKVSAQIRQIEALPDPQLRRQVLDLLQGVDAIHREALHRLVRLFAPGVLEKVITDPAIHTLMELYDLLPGEDTPPASATPPPTLRPFPDIPIKVAPRPKPAPPPHWVPVLEPADRLPADTTQVVTADDTDLLLCRVSDQWFAVAAHCTRDQSPLAGAMLRGYTLVCPRHTACYYDVRQGARLGGGESLRCYPVKSDERGRLLVGFGVEFTPRLPAF